MGSYPTPCALEPEVPAEPYTKMASMEPNPVQPEVNTRQLTSGTSTTISNSHTYFVTNDYSYNVRSRHNYGDSHVTTNYNGGAANVNSARDLLLNHVSHGALHNSAERGPDAPKCYPETRVAVQGEILSWIKYGHQDTNPKRVLWLSGPAGSGKTAVAGTIADAEDINGMLAASFFFSSFGLSRDRCTKISLIATLVYQLIQHPSIHGLRAEVLAALDHDPLIFKRDLDAQLNALILNPLRTVFGRSDSKTWPQLVLIDGLDECEGEKSKDDTEQSIRMSREDIHQEILSVLIGASNCPFFPFRIIIASRPEQAIKRFFSSVPKGTIKEIFLNSKYEPEADIKLYVEAMLIKIGRDHGLPEDWHSQAIPLDWPDACRDVPSYLAQEASEQFIYAATVIRYVRDGTDTPLAQLKRLLTWRRQGSGKLGPFAALDELYTRILQTSPTPLVSVKWLRAIQQCLAQGPLVAWFVKALLESSPREADFFLGSITSLIGLTSDNGDSEFSFYHKSLLDFLSDPSRCGKLYVNYGSVVRPFIDDRFYRVFKNRGPDILLPADDLDEFVRLLCSNLYWHLPDTRKFQYNASDVDWWISQIDFTDKEGFILMADFIFEEAHRNVMSLVSLPPSLPCLEKEHCTVI